MDFCSTQLGNLVVKKMKIGPCEITEGKQHAGPEQQRLKMCDLGRKGILLDGIAFAH